MNSVFRNALAVAGLAIATQAIAQVTFYEGEGFEGRSFTTQQRVGNFERKGFNDGASSAVVVSDRWEVCEDNWYRGQCMVLRPGRYQSLAAMGLESQITSVRTVSRNARIAENRYAPAPVAERNRNAAPQLTFYEHEDFGGRSFTTEEQIGNLQRQGFNDRASSAVVAGDRWEVCDDARFNGRCAVLRPGRYPSLAAMGLNDRISSVRTASNDANSDNNRYAPAPVADNNYRRRSNEQLYEAQVTSVHAVVGPPEQRCWVEQEQVPQERKANVGGAIAGAVIGGILGHQVGAGRGKDVATVGGAVAGGLIGANAGRDSGQQATTKDVQHCENIPSQAKPEFWDVTYNFRGQEHRIQMTAPPGPSVTVNEQGEPRE